MNTGRLGQLGQLANAHRAAVIAAWAVLAIGLGFFAPRLEGALSGAMWEVEGSDSLAARQLIERNFGGFSSQSAVVVIHSDSQPSTAAAFQARVAGASAILSRTPAFTAPAPPQLSRDGHTVLLQSGATVDPTGAVRAAEAIHDEIGKLSGDGVVVALTGAPAFWADFNAVNREGMLKAELVTWPVTALILVIAFGSLAAAGLPLLLTAVGLITAMGVLFGLTQFMDLSIWTFNFAMMFALALGIDYALFMVTRFRAALHATHGDRREAVGVTMDTSGKAVLFSGLTVLVSLSAVLLVPIPAFRSVAAGMMLSVAFVLLASLTLLPAVLGRGIDRVAMPWHSVGEHRSTRFAALSQRIQRRPGLVAAAVGAVLLLGAAPLLGLRTGMPGITVLPPEEQARRGYELIARAFGPGGVGPLQLVIPVGLDAAAISESVAKTAGVAGVSPAQRGADGGTLVTAFANSDPSSQAASDLVSRLRDNLPKGVLVGGPVAENHDLDQSLKQRTPLVIGVVLGLGFLLLLVALRAVFLALAGVLLNLLSVGAAFGAGTLAFQHGWASGPMGFEGQGYLTSWAPLFFFTLVFAISMDYTVFLLASAREHFEQSGDAEAAITGAMAHTGRPIVAAAGVMIAVFFAFALAGPLPMKEMGFILGTAVLADAFLVRLLLVPALLQLAGKRAWWLPRWAGRLLPTVRFAE